MSLEQGRTHWSANRYSFTGGMRCRKLPKKLIRLARIARGHNNIHAYFVEGKPNSLLSEPTSNAVWQPEDTQSFWAQGTAVQNNSKLSQTNLLSVLGHCGCNQLQHFSITSCRGELHDWSLWFTSNKRSSIFQLWFHSKVIFGSFTALHSEKAINCWNKASCLFFFFLNQTRISKSTNALGKPFNHFDIFLRDIIKRHRFP